MSFDREMQRALMMDAQKLRDMGVDAPDPLFLDAGEDLRCVECGAATTLLERGADGQLRCVRRKSRRAAPGEGDAT